MSEEQGLPELPKVDPQAPAIVHDLEKIRYQATVDLYKAQQQAILDQEKAVAADDVERRKAAYANDYAMAQAVHNAYIEIAKGQVAGAAAKADFVQKAAAAISTAYVAIVGLAFGVGEHSTVLPIRGILPTIFLGLSIFMATAYSAFITEPGTMEEESGGGTLASAAIARRNTFILWTQSVPLSRRYLLQVAVIALGFAVAYLPAPFVQMPDETVRDLVFVGLGCSFALPVIIWLLGRLKSKLTE
jgi:hypothetical protein